MVKETWQNIPLFGSIPSTSTSNLLPRRSAGIASPWLWARHIATLVVVVAVHGSGTRKEERVPLLPKCAENASNGMNELAQFDHWIAAVATPLAHARRRLTPRALAPARRGAFPHPEAAANATTARTPLDRRPRRPRRRLGNKATTAYTFSEREARADGCVHFTIRQEPLPDGLESGGSGGGSTFYVLAVGDERRMCAVRDAFDGTYAVACARPAHGRYLDISVELGYEHFEARAPSAAAGARRGDTNGLAQS